MRRILFMNCILALTTISCQSPIVGKDSAFLAVQVNPSSDQMIGTELSLAGSGVATILQNRNTTKYELKKNSSGLWQAEVSNPLSIGAQVSVQVFSGPNHDGLLLFQGTKTVAEDSQSGLVLVTINNISRINEKFSGKIGTGSGTDIYQIDSSTWVAFVYGIDVIQEVDINDRQYSIYQVDYRQDTKVSKRKLKETGTISRQAYKYTFQVEKEYDDTGNPISPSGISAFAMNLDDSGYYLTYDGTTALQLTRN